MDTEEEKPKINSFQNLIEGKAELIAVHPVVPKVIVGNKRRNQHNRTYS